MRKRKGDEPKKQGDEPKKLTDTTRVERRRTESVFKLKVAMVSDQQKAVIDSMDDTECRKLGEFAQRESTRLMRADADYQPGDTYRTEGILQMKQRFFRVDVGLQVLDEDSVVAYFDVLVEISKEEAIAEIPTFDSFQRLTN